MALGASVSLANEKTWHAERGNEGKFSPSLWRFEPETRAVCALRRRIEARDLSFAPARTIAHPVDFIGRLDVEKRASGKSAPRSRVGRETDAANGREQPTANRCDSGIDRRRIDANGQLRYLPLEPPFRRERLAKSARIERHRERFRNCVKVSPRRTCRTAEGPYRLSTFSG